MAALENAQFNTNSMQRVKVYRLNEDGNWDDRGTGLVSMDYMERSQELGLYVIDEDDNETLLVHRISTEDIYRKQEDTIISWRDPERSTELALSFQETAGCSHVWNQIAIMRRNLHFSSLNSEPFHNVNYELRELPDVELSTLPLIHQVDFFGNLMGEFEICEESNNVDDLHMIFDIVKGIISLNSSQILEKIFGDKLIMQILGCLEYDTNVPQPQHHRKYLREHVVLKEDDNVDSYVVKNNMLKPVIDVLVGGGNRDNLLTSAVLELLEHIRKANSTGLLKYVVGTLWDQLARFEHLASIQDFKTKYEQKVGDNDVKENRDEEKPASASSTQKDEANPHNSNVAAASSASPRSGGLVDYEDDEDGEDCKPHPKKQPEASKEEKKEELLRLKNKIPPCRENEQEQCHKKPRLCSTVDGNRNSTVQGGEAKEPESSRSRNRNSTVFIFPFLLGLWNRTLSVSGLRKLCLSGRMRSRCGKEQFWCLCGILFLRHAH